MGSSESKEKQIENDVLAQSLRDDPTDLILKNYLLILNQLDTVHAIDQLYHNSALNDEEFKKLAPENTAQPKTKMLINMLIKKSPAQIQTFIDIIKEHQRHLYNMMVSNTIHGKECEPCTEQEKKRAATEWCCQCCEAMCADCARFHKSMKALKNHSFKKLSELTLEAKIELGDAILPKTLQEKKPEYVEVHHSNTFQVSFNGDKESSASATDLVHTIINNVSILLVSDWHNECVKSFTEIGTKIKCKRLMMAGCPLRITKLSPNEIAVTVSNSFLISVIKVGIGVLQKSFDIKASKNYEAIGVLADGKFAVCGETVDIIDAKGTILATLGKEEDGMHMFNCKYLTITPQNDIVLSDHRNCRVICVNQKGEIQWSFQKQSEPKMECPHGVCCDRNGNVYIADWDSHHLLMLSPDGTFKQILVTARNRLYRPRTICVDDKCERIYVAEDSGPVKIYKMVCT